MASPARSNAGHTRRKQNARQKLIIAADELFDELGGLEGGGYEATTVDLITARAGVSRRSFFNHFSGKADVLLLDLRTSIEDHVDAFKKHPADEDPVVSAIKAGEEIYDSFFSDPISVRRAERQVAMTGLTPSQWSLIGEWEQKLAAQIFERLKGPNKPERAVLMAGLSVTILRTATQQWFASGMKSSKGLTTSIRKTAELANKVLSDSQSS